MASLKHRAFVFPGQGSQRVGMFDDYAGSSEFADTIAEASAVLAMDLCKLSKDEQTINDTCVTQPLMLAAGIGAYRAWLAAGGEKPVMLAGHSLGEYAALVASSALTFPDALKLVALRAIAMQQAATKTPGVMCAVIGLARDKVAAICTQINQAAWLANINTDIQLVVAGERDAVQAVADECRAQGAKRAVQLPMSVPSHCPMMEQAARQFKDAMNLCSFADCVIPVVQNATSTVVSDKNQIKSNLLAQLVLPVDWVACVKRLRENAIQIVECGPGRVLFGINRRLISADDCAALDSSDAIAALRE